MGFTRLRLRPVRCDPPGCLWFRHKRAGKRHDTKRDMQLRILPVVVGLFASAILFVPVSFSQNSRAAHFCDGRPAIQPGIGIGKLKLGMPVTEMIKVVGEPPRKANEGSASGSKWLNLYYFRLSDIDVFARDSVVVEIALGNGAPKMRGCQTSEGIGVGERMTDKITKLYGKPEAEMRIAPSLRLVIYNSRGTAMYVNSRGEILGLELFAPGTFCVLNKDLATLGWSGIDCKKLTPPLK